MGNTGNMGYTLKIIKEFRNHRCYPNSKMGNTDGYEKA